MDTNNFCACGCGEPVTGRAKYVKGHSLNKLIIELEPKILQDDRITEHWEKTRKQASHSTPHGVK